jgi:hypothetical protein
MTDQVKMGLSGLLIFQLKKYFTVGEGPALSFLYLNHGCHFPSFNEILICPHVPLNPQNYFSYTK